MKKKFILHCKHHPTYPKQTFVLGRDTTAENGGSESGNEKTKPSYDREDTADQKPLFHGVQRAVFICIPFLTEEEGVLIPINFISFVLG